jgi:hypothetical protein
MAPSGLAWRTGGDDGLLGALQSVDLVFVSRR